VTNAQTYENLPELRNLPHWALSNDSKSIHRTWKMRDFSTAVDFIGVIRDAAEGMDHHPDIHLTGYRNLEIELSTHSAGGLTSKDFELAAKIEALYKRFK